jgi:small subunit ribosomal protein S3
MGQKVHPTGLRLGYNKPWRSRWFAAADYAKLLHEDLKLKKELKARFQHAGVSKIEDRARHQQAEGRHLHLAPRHHHRAKGQEVDKLKQELQKRTKREVFINIQEIQKPELDAQLVAESVAGSSRSASPSAGRCARPSNRRCASAPRASRSASRAA